MASMAETTPGQDLLSYSPIVKCDRWLEFIPSQGRPPPTVTNGYGLSLNDTKLYVSAITVYYAYTARSFPPSLSWTKRNSLTAHLLHPAPSSPPSTRARDEATFDTGYLYSVLPTPTHAH
jgi:hypothetical protein